MSLNKDEIYAEHYPFIMDELIAVIASQLHDLNTLVYADIDSDTEGYGEGIVYVNYNFYGYCYIRVYNNQVRATLSGGHITAGQVFYQVDF